MKEGINNNFNAPIILNGGTLNGDIINPTYNFGGKGELSEQDKRKMALDCMDGHIRQEIAKPNRMWKNVLAPLVAAIRVGLLPNTMTYVEFNTKYGTDISESTFYKNVSKEIGNSAIPETDTEAFENEYNSLLNT